MSTKRYGKLTSISAIETKTKKKHNNNFICTYSNGIEVIKLHWSCQLSACDSFLIAIVCQNDENIFQVQYNQPIRYWWIPRMFSSRFTLNRNRFSQRFGAMVVNLRNREPILKFVQKPTAKRLFSIFFITVSTVWLGALIVSSSCRLFTQSPVEYIRNIVSIALYILASAHQRHTKEIITIEKVKSLDDE